MSDRDDDMSGCLLYIIALCVFSACVDVCHIRSDVREIKEAVKAPTARGTRP